MAATNLIIALVFAGIFGAALIYVALWFAHRYIHQGCYELEHWFNCLFSSQSRLPPSVYVEKAEQRESPKHRSRSTKREPGRPERSQTRKYYENRDRESHDAHDAHADWSRPRDVEMARPTIQFNTSTQPQQQQSYGQSYHPSLGQKQWPGANQVECFPQIQQQIPMSWQAQGMAHMPPFAIPAAVPQQPFPQVAARMPEPQHPTQYLSQYQPREQPHYRQTYTETMSSDIPKASQRRTLPVKPKSPARRARRVEKVDFIHICDEYPPIVLEALKKTAHQSSSSSSSSSSDTSGTTQEVPRASIPRATPGFADTLPFEFPQYPHAATRAWNTPRSYPRQWNRDTMGVNGPDAQARYAPFTPMSGYTASPWGLYTNRRRSATKSSAARSRSYERWRQRTTSPRDSGPRKDQPREEGHDARGNNTKLNEDTRQGNEREPDVTSIRHEQPELGGRNDRQPERNPGKEHSSTTQKVPRYSPMPIPVIEEPYTPTSDGHTSIPKVPPASGSAVHPKTSPAPLSPISHTRNPLRPPRLSVSSLDKSQ